MFDQFTLGIEEEFQIVDPTTRELRSHVAEILAEGKMLLGEQIKPEMIQSMVEVGTGICRNIQEAREDITRLRSVIAGLAKKNGLVIVAASTHPISRWQDQKIFDDERYELLVQELQTVARSLLIFGLHVHVGMADRERAIHIMNAALPAARARPLNVVAVLDGPQHRTQIVSHRNIQTVSADRHSRSLRLLRQFRALRKSAREDGLHQ
jgi:carboxylate-amine ligase